MTLRSVFNRQRMNTLKAELADWIRIDSKNRLANAAANQPTIEGNLNDRQQTMGQVTDQEGIRYRIAATVVGQVSASSHFRPVAVHSVRAPLRSRGGVRP